MILSRNKTLLVLVVLVALAVVVPVGLSVVPVMADESGAALENAYGSAPKVSREEFEALASVDHKAPITLRWAKRTEFVPQLPNYLKYDENKLTEVIDQGKCAACWSIATTGMLADRISVYTNAAIREPLSNQEMISCWDGHEGKGCSHGGIPELAMKYLIEHGVLRERDFPYAQQHTNKIQPCNTAKKFGPRVFAQAGTDVSLCIDPYQYTKGSSKYASTVRSNIANMKKELYMHGPIVGTIMIYAGAYDYDGLSVYTGPTAGEKFVGGHALEIIGYCDEGVNGDEPGFDQAYWICKQSWGKEYPSRTPAASGYMYVKMGVNCVGIESRASACLPVVTPEIVTNAVDSLEHSRFSSYEQYRESHNRKNFVTTSTVFGRAYARLLKN